jgi:hypothetical protein
MGSNPSGATMKILIDAVCATMADDDGTPPIVRNAFLRMQDKFSRPAEPTMSQEEFDALPALDKSILTCNVIGCGKMVSTHGMVCVQHGIDLRNGDYSTIPQVPMKNET